MSKNTSVLPPLGELELAVLEQLWSCGEAEVVQVHAAVGKQRGITPNTVGSALERLFKKGFVRRYKVSHAFRYEALVDREEFAARRVLHAAGDLQTLAGAGLLSAFVDLVADVDEDALDHLEALIVRKRRSKEAK